MKPNSITYNLLTLDANYMVKEGFNETQQLKPIGTSKNPKCKVEYHYNVTEYDNYSAGQDIIKSKAKHQDCALFRQLALLLAGNSKDIIKDKYLLYESLIIVDFKDLFKSISKIDSTDVNTKYKEAKADVLKTKGEPETDSIVYGYRLRWMFDTENGIQLSFDGTKTWKTFVPFDKSNSMAKDCRITFIEKELKERFEKRLLLDIFYPNNITGLTPSKYYAYRGLYLSSGSRIEQGQYSPSTTELGKKLATVLGADFKFELNEETVIVIENRKQKLATLDIAKDSFTKNTKAFSQKLFTAEQDADSKVWNCDEKNLCDFSGEIDSFDGEGFICPEYAQYINKELGNKKEEKAAHTFQIRMPFTKGMLHEVDFNKFFDEQLPNGNIPANNELLIEDAFGIQRDLRKAKIILTASMFKCKKWFEKLIDTNELAPYLYDGPSIKEPKPEFDYMKFYFDKVREYQHSLYISLTDTQLTAHTWRMPQSTENAQNEQPGETKPRFKYTVPLNYQFLSTLALKEDDVKYLVEEHKKYIETINESIRLNVDADLLNETEDSDEQTAIDEIETGWFAERNKCLHAWRKNDAFKEHPKFRNKIKEIIANEKNLYTRNLLLGRVETDGEQRFLSGDLLGLLTYICQSITNLAISEKEKEAIVKKMWTQCLRPHRFYMSEKHIAVRSNKDYGILRNPHLSKNEQCILRPYMKSLHERYFSHLKGVIMVSCLSSVPMALGGADFDGDLVKIISNKTIVNAIRRGVYKDSKGYPYERELPVIKIPSPSNTITFKNNDSDAQLFHNISNTFANQIGKISNIAVRLTKAATNGEQLPDNICPAACTIITGLEIDAAKTGEHPTDNIKQLIEATTKKGKYADAKEAFIEIKDKTKELPGYYSLNSLNKIMKEDITLPHDKSNLEVLLEHAFSYIQDNVSQKPKEQENRQSTTFPKCFIFEDSANWKDLDENTKDRFGKLIQSYLAIKSLAWNVYNFNEAGKNNASYVARFRTLLNIQYDSFYQKLACGVSVSEALSETSAFIANTLKENANVASSDEENKTALFSRMLSEAIACMDDIKWQYAGWDKEKYEKTMFRAEKVADILLTGIKDKNEFAIAKNMLLINPQFPVVRELLTNFNNSGFMVFYFLLKDIQERILKREMDIETYFDLNKEDMNFKGIDDSKDFKKLRGIYAKYKMNNKDNKNQAGWRQEAIRHVRNALFPPQNTADSSGETKSNHLFKNQKEALQYICLSPNQKVRNLLWEIFTEQEILESVIPFNELKNVRKDGAAQCSMK